MATKVRERRVWPAVVTASLASAVLACGTTLGVVAATGGFDSPVTLPASSAVVPASQLQEGSVERVAAAVRDSVVAIEVATTQGGSEGSGVVLDSAGHILTNDHVVSGAREIRVTLADGRIFAARMMGTDPTTDLAVIALVSPPADIVPATLGDSEALIVGEEVVAVGNPLGLSSTVTSGIVSALDRPVTTSSTSGRSPVVTNAIQVDAAINPGNSGGPLFDLGGNVIGITSSIATLSQGQSGSIGLGFAIPVGLASRVAEEIIATGAARHALLGVGLSDGVASAGGVTRTGAELREVVAGSAAAEAGLRTGDVVVSVDGRAVSGADSLTGFVRAESPGTTVRLGVVRDGAELEVEVALGEA
nr:trypsin-like serine protease [Actinomycetales bacterium]